MLSCPVSRAFLFLLRTSRGSGRKLFWKYPARSLEGEEQRQRPPPVAETGSCCWGRGLQDASAAQGTKQMQGAAKRIYRMNLLETLALLTFILALLSLVVDVIRLTVEVMAKFSQMKSDDNKKD